MRSDVLCTVIIPYYNTEKKVFDRCMRSLLPCPENVQILIVDDGSDADHRDIPAQYRDENITLLRKQNGGVSSARNAALDVARGRYILFVDSDDRVKSGFAAELCRRAEQFDAEVLISGITIMPRNERQPTQYPKACVMSGRELVLQNENVFRSFDLCYSVRMCFKRSLIEKNHLRFCTDMTISEDMVFNIEALLAAERVVSVDEAFYEYWLDTENSATRAPYHAGFLQSFERQYACCRRLVGQDENARRQLAEFYMDFVFYNLIRNQKAGGGLSKKEYDAICDMPMFRESMLLLGAAHPCENRKAQMLYKLRYRRLYLLPYLAAVK